eukprot:2834373-Alexandrium_andersonii.AAC.1
MQYSAVLVNGMQCSRLFLDASQPLPESAFNCSAPQTHAQDCTILLSCAFAASWPLRACVGAHWVPLDEELPTVDAGSLAPE